MTQKILAALLLAFVLGACGQSGPLYIPGDPSSIDPPPEQSQNGEEKDDEDGDSGGQ